VVALKKSRVSIKTKRTALPHEGEVLSLLAGHPSIPNVFAHGRSDHFEYLATELLGQSLAAKVKNDGKLKLSDVLRIADQMLSALRYIHNYRIVHRDIKPGNIVVRETDPTKFCLIDFGIAKPCIMGEPKSVDIYAERFYPVGTLVWASLNSHNGIDLGPRDDLESLGYTLLYLLRGELPWTRLEGHSTVLANAAHIRQKKYAWTGSGLAQGLPREFGQLVDYARSLQYHDTIDYDGFRARFSMIRGEAND
ncbi:kinase-like protein, partial [Artomyces pyxidatus]